MPNERVVLPTPQQIDLSDGTVEIPAAVTISGSADDATMQVVIETLQAAGVGEIRPDAELTIDIGFGSGDVLGRLGIDGPDDLPADGYVLATGSIEGRPHVVLSGVDATGTFYAAQTFRQLVEGRTVPQVTIRDWPAFGIRGAIEGFYGTPWSTSDRLDQLDFYGRYKLNAYEYAPKDDPYHRELWREPYPPAELARLEQLVERAAANHVRFIFALSPGLSVCYSSEEDLQALIAKFEQVYRIGVRTFDIPFDDIHADRWNGPLDEEKFGTGMAAAGVAQAYLLNRVNAEFVAGHDDVGRLQTVATEYYEIIDSPYKQALREHLDPDVIVAWTGTAVVPAEITVDEARTAREVFGHDLLLWDNYPVNDYQRGRLAMAPYTGRHGGLADYHVALLANPMNQAAAGKTALISVADYAWNSAAFDAHEAWDDAITAYAGDDELADALEVFADTQHWMKTMNGVDAPQLAQALADTGRTAEFVELFRRAPHIIGARAESAFVAETAPWLSVMRWYGDALEAALRLQNGEQGENLRQRIENALRDADSVLDPIDEKTPIKVAYDVVSVYLRSTLDA